MNDNFTDSYADETDHGSQDPIDEHGFGWSDRQEPHVLSIEPTKLNKDEIEYIKPLLTTMATANRAEPSDDECSDLIVDEALCDVAEMALQTVGWDNPEDTEKLRALIIPHIITTSRFQRPRIPSYSPSRPSI